MYKEIQDLTTELSNEKVTGDFDRNSSDGVMGARDNGMDSRGTRGKDLERAR